MEIEKVGKAIQETSYDKKTLANVIITLNREEKEALYKWFREENMKLDYDIEDYRKKIEEIRNRLYEYRKSN